MINQRRAKCKRTRKYIADEYVMVVPIEMGMLESETPPSAIGAARRLFDIFHQNTAPTEHKNRPQAFRPRACLKKESMDVSLSTNPV